VAVLVLILMLTVSLWGAQVRRRRWYFFVAGLSAFAIALGIAVPRLGLTSLELTPGNVVLLAGLVLLTIDIIGLPRQVALRTRLGLHSNEWLYDGKLYRLFKPLNDLLNAEPPLGHASHGPWKRRVQAVARSTLTRARELKSPNHDWAALTHDYVEVYEAIIDIVTSGEDGSRRSWVYERSQKVDSERERLRRRYRDEAKAALRGNDDVQ